MPLLGLAAIAALRGHAPGGFALPTERVIGNQNQWTGSPGDTPAAPGPHPATQPMGGQVGRNDGYSGPDPSRPETSPWPRVDVNGAEQETWRRYGLQGFNDQLQVRDRHVYWDRGRSRYTGPLDSTGGSRNPNLDGPARPDLRSVNISVNPQIGSDSTRNADDLSRPYTWLGQQDGSRQAVYGGVPGLWQAYGNRGMSSGIHDPSNGQGGPAMVYSGPPHGLHSNTMASGQQIARRYQVTPQMKPPRLDRPDNSRIAGQSYSQTVEFQGQQPRSAPAMSRGVSFGFHGHAGFGNKGLSGGFNG